MIAAEEDEAAASLGGRTMLMEVRGRRPSIGEGRGTDVDTRNGRTGELGRETGGVGASKGVDAVEESSC